MLSISEIYRTIELLRQIRSMSASSWQNLPPESIGALTAEAAICEINLDCGLRSVLRNSKMPAPFSALN